MLNPLLTLNAQMPLIVLKDLLYPTPYPLFCVKDSTAKAYMDDWIPILPVPFVIDIQSLKEFPLAFKDAFNVDRNRLFPNLLGRERK